MGTLREGRIPMSFDEMYDEMLHDEFSSSGKHQAQAGAVEPVESTSRGRHAAADGAERPRGFQRYRTAALVGAGGLACAAAGAFLGGLGGYFSISPAAAHQVGASTITQDLPLAQAVDNAAHSSSSGAPRTSAVAGAAAQFSKVSGSLTQGIAPFATLTSLPLQNLPVTGIPGLYNGSGGSGTGVIDSGTVDGTTLTGQPGNNPTGCTSADPLGLTCMVASLSGALTSLGSVPDPGSLLNTLPGLDGVVTNVTVTLQSLTGLLPIASLPTGGIVPTTVLAGIGGGSLAGAPAATSSTSSPVGALAPVLNTVGSLSGGLGSTTSPATPSLPLPSLPSLPLPSLPSLPLPSLPSTGSTLPTSLPSGTTASPTVTTQSSGSSSGGSTTVNVPLPLPISPTQPISIGGLSVGISSTGSTSGLTLTLP